jgi:hypothetical protein
MPDLDLIKQGEQACDPPEVANMSSTGCFNEDRYSTLSSTVPDS